MSIFENARKNSLVCPKELIKIVHESEAHHKKVINFLEHVKKCAPKEEAAKFHEMDRISQIKFAYKFLADMIRTGDMDFSKGNYVWESFYMTPFEISGGVSMLMVRPLITTLCSPKQQEKWLPLFDSSRVIGAYAQTELGHGSDVQSLETESVYDERTKEFVLHTPSVSSMKWWPGELSNLSNIAIVFAKTIVKGRKIGVFPFIVQIRDMQTHKPLSGIEIGDIGPKMGYGAKENGFLKFTHCRIPLENMPSRFIEVTENGDVIQKGNPKIMYSSMMKSRTALLSNSAYSLGKAVAIAIRYSHLRKQFKNDLKEEIPVIQYQLQQFKLFPLLAKAFAMMCCFRKITQIVEITDNQINQNNFQNLQETHVILSGAKAFFTWWCSNGLTVCMQCCGGHGYSQASGIPNIMQSFAPNTILEGENTILTLQVGRFLLKSYRYLSEGKIEKLNGYCEYMKNADDLNSFNRTFDADLLNMQSMKKLWQKAVCTKVAETAELIIELSANLSMTDIFNKKIGIHVFEMAKLHSILFSFDFFLSYVNGIEHLESKKGLLNLVHLFIIDLTLECTGILLSVKVINNAQVKSLQQEFERLLEEILKDCLKLSDGFVVDDYVLHSALADSNEKPYENLYNLAKSTGIVNQTDLTGVYLETIRRASIETFGKPKL